MEAALRRSPLNATIGDARTALVHENTGLTPQYFIANGSGAKR